MKVYISNQQKKIRLPLKKIERDSLKVLKTLGLRGAELSILFVSSERMKELNLKYRGINTPTDVLSFPFYTHQELKGVKGTTPYLLGDIVINPSEAKAQAKEHSSSLKEEIRLLIIHSILHLLGYDHEKSRYAERKMRKMERYILEELG